MSPAAAPGARLEVRDVTVSYGDTVALRRVSFACGPGELLGVVGPNGAGKSTLIKAVLGLVTLDHGTVRIDGRDVDTARRDVAYLPQRSEIDWDYPAVVREVVAMGRYVQRGMWGRLRADDHRRVDAALARMGMTELAGRQVGELSGGQQQRMFVARALAQDARLLLLDEPFAAIDAVTEQLLHREFRALADEGRTLVVIAHDLVDAERAFDRVLLLDRRVVAHGPPATVLRGEHLRRAYGALPGGGMERR